MIPKRLIRVVPAHTTDQVEQWWWQARALHPDWEHITLREPHNPEHFPLTHDYWPTCQTGAQMADLVRLEELFHHGGVYIDSDIECWKPFTPLLHHQAFAGWEDHYRICNAVIGAEPDHPAILAALALSLVRHDQGTEQAGVQAFTDTMANRHDITLLPTKAFFPVHWSQRARLPNINRATLRAKNPDSYCLHWWAKSWATPCA
jgi:mannosyltransferase OCH1-like enzyme